MQSLVFVFAFILVSLTSTLIADESPGPDCIPIVGGYDDDFCAIRVDCHMEPRHQQCQIAFGIPVVVEYWVEVCLYYDNQGNVRRIESIGYPPR